MAKKQKAKAKRKASKPRKPDKLAGFAEDLAKLENIIAGMKEQRTPEAINETPAADLKQVVVSEQEAMAQAAQMALDIVQKLRASIGK